MRLVTTRLVEVFKPVIVVGYDSNIERIPVECDRPDIAAGALKSDQYVGDGHLLKGVVETRRLRKAIAIVDVEFDVWDLRTNIAVLIFNGAF